MTTVDKSATWEDKLDEELTKLVGRHGSPPGLAVSGGAQSRPPNPPPQDRPVQDSGIISVREFRLIVHETLRRDEPSAWEVCDEYGELLLPAGAPITKSFVELLRQRGITRLRLRSGPRRETAPYQTATQEELTHTPHSRQLDEKLAGELQKQFVRRPVKPWRRPRLPIDELKSQATEGLEKHHQTSLAVADLCGKLTPGERISATELQSSVTHFVDAATVDFDLLPMILAMHESKDEYLYDHCVSVALMSMAIASQLGLQRDGILEIGLGGMLHDIGMLRVPSAIRCKKDPLTKDEWKEIHRHPLHTLDMLADIRGIPAGVRFIAYQAHERLNGEGYPRRRSGKALHEYAKIVSVADVYVAMTSPRPHRPPLAPYTATKLILDDVACNKFDRELVRAFLDTVSLFPIGSRVELNNGATARVLRANTGLHTRPVVEELGSDGTPNGQIIDLARDDTLRVVEAS